MGVDADATGFPVRKLRVYDSIATYSAVDNRESLV